MARVLAFAVLTVMLCLPALAQETPTPEPSPTPTDLPTATPIPTFTPEPTPFPTLEPTLYPTLEPTLTASPAPEMTAEVTAEPEATPLPTLEVSETPAALPTLEITPQVLTETPSARTTRGREAKVDAELLALFDALAAGNLPQARALATEGEMLITQGGGSIRVEIITATDEEAARLRPIIEGMGGLFLLGYRTHAEYDFPLTMLDALNGVPGDFFVRQPLRPRTLSGRVVTQGLAPMGVEAWHTRGFRGQGIRVGVIDVGFFGHPNSDTGCVRGANAFDPLPTTLTANGDHGTSVAEIICDIAPQSEVFLASANSLSALNAAMDWLIAQNVRIINMSMAWFETPGDGTGLANNIVNRAIDRGIVFVASAGNSNGHTWDRAYTNRFEPSPPILGLGSINFMDFGDGSIVLRLEGGCGLFQIGLRWSDWNAARTGNVNGYDLDLHLVRSTDGGRTWSWVASSDSDQAGLRTIRPTEYLSMTPTCSVGDLFGIAISRWSASAPVYLQVESYTTPLSTPAPSGSITTPADNPSVIAVAASAVLRHPDWPWSTRGYPDVAVYSSRGPTLGPGGTAPVGFISKPDLTAPTHTSTTRDARFSGTSAAAPHAAGAFAVMLSFDALLGRGDLLAFVRPAAGSDSGACDAQPVLCFGRGVLSLPPLWDHWGDTVREHTSTGIVRTGAVVASPTIDADVPRWDTISTAAFPVAQRASGGSFIATRSPYAQIRFSYTAAAGIMIDYYRMPSGFAGCSMEVVVYGTVWTTVSLDGAGSHQRETVLVREPVPLGGAADVVLRGIGGPTCGITFDTVWVVAGLQYQEDDPNLSYAGAWTRVPQVGSSGGAYRIAATAGASISFWTDNTRLRFTYTARPDGGLMDVLSNGQLIGTVDMYSPTLFAQAIDQFWLGGGGPHFIQLVATGRRNPPSRGTIVSLDAIRLDTRVEIPPVSTVTALPLPSRPSLVSDLAGTGGIFVLPVNGAWTRGVSTASFGGARWSAANPGAEILFRTGDGPRTGRRLLVYFTGAPNGGIVEVWANGALCSACGTIDTYRPANMPRSVAFVTLPDSLPLDLTIGLRISGERHPNSTGTSFAFEGASVTRVRILPLEYRDVAMNGFHVLLRTTIAGNTNMMVPQALPGAVYGDLHALAIPPRDPLPFTLRTREERVGVLVARSPQGGQLHILGTNSTGTYRLALVDLNATRTLPRELIVVQRPATTPPFAQWSLTLITASPAATGGAANFVFIDGFIGLGPEDIFAGEGIASESTSDPRRLEIGAGWSDAPAAVAVTTVSAALGIPLRRTNVPGSALTFTYTVTDSSHRYWLVYSRLPDGGIAELFVNGQRWGEINFYSPTPLHRQLLVLPSGTGRTFVVEIRATSRRSPGASGTWMYVDAIAALDRALAAPLTNSANAAQENDPRIARIGTGWSALTPTPAGVVIPLGVVQRVSSGGSIRFATNERQVFIVRTLTPNGGFAEVLINNRVCSDCGPIPFFNPVNAYGAAWELQIPARFTAPYIVELRTTTARPAGSSGTQIAIDMIVPASGALPDLAAALPMVQSSSTNTSGVWTTVTRPAGALGAQTLSGGTAIAASASGACAWFTAPFSNPTVTIYTTHQPNGGVAEIRTAADVDGLLADDAICTTCGSINTHAPTPRFQQPFTFTAPVATGGLIAVCNTGARPPGSSGTLVELDAASFR